MYRGECSIVQRGLESEYVCSTSRQIVQMQTTVSRISCRPLSSISRISGHFAFRGRRLNLFASGRVHCILSLKGMAHTQSTAGEQPSRPLPPLETELSIAKASAKKLVNFQNVFHGRHRVVIDYESVLIFEPGP